MKLVKVISLAVGVILFALLFVLRPASAVSDGTWSWTNAKPVVFRSTEVSGVVQYTCSAPYQMHEVSGNNYLRKICITPGKNVSFGNTTFVDRWGDPTKFIGFSFDDKLYNFNGPCDGYEGCLYVPGTDTLVTKQRLHGYCLSLVVYKNFTKRLSKIHNGMSVEYNFDSSNPDYIFQSADGYAWPIGGVAASDDGEWLGLEIRERGIGLLNLKTMEMKSISTMYYRYGFGRDPSSELAVSNGGHQVAIMGMNAGFTVIDVVQGCGDIANDDRMNSGEPISKPCKVADTNVSDYIDRFNMAINPRFSSDGSELDFYAMSYTAKEREVALRAAGVSGQKLDYLALGDSYSSGEGESDDKYYLPGTNEKYEKCHVSKRSYPYLVANLSNIDPTFVKSVACSGAETVDVVGDMSSYMGQDDRLKDKNLNFNSNDIALAKPDARYNFIPGRTLQEDFVNQYAPKTITIGIGGNDAGLVEKLTDCVSTNTCSWASDIVKREQTAKEIKGVYSKLVNTYQKLHQDSPESKIYAIGYPKVVDETGDCGMLLNSFLDNTEKKFMNETIKYLNKVVEQAAKAAGVKYVDVYDSFGGQLLCGNKSPAAMNGIRKGEETNPIGDSDWFRVIGSESFHPTAEGHKLIAKQIVNTLGDISSYEYCPGGATICPDQSAAAPDPDNTDYWMPEGVHDYPSLKKAALVADCTEAQCRDNNAQITLDSYSLSPGSEVTVEINSQPRLLGKFVAGDDGSLSAAVNLPDDLDEGYHTVHVYGSSFSGEAVDLYQVISYQKPSKPNDNTNNTDNTPPDAQAIVNSPAESGPVASVRPIVAENKIKAGADVDEQNLSHEVIHPEVMGAATTKPVDFAQANSPQKSSRSAGYGATFYYALVGVAVFVVALSVVTWLVANKRKPARG